MKVAFGNDWIKHRVPGTIQQAWKDKREKARDNGERERPLIAYADFTDYETIITKKDNWTTIFKPVFKQSLSRCPRFLWHEAGCRHIIRRQGAEKGRKRAEARPPTASAIRISSGQC